MGSQPLIGRQRITSPQDSPSRSREFLRLMDSLETREHRGLTLLETVKSANLTLLLKAVEAIEAVYKMDNKSILC